MAQSPVQDGAATFALQTRPFIVEPSDAPLLVREGETPPQLNCSVGDQFRDRNRYELEWTKVVGDTPNLVSRNGRLFADSGPDGYELLDTVGADGGYNLRLRSVQLQRDNGRFFCALIDTLTRQQTLSEPARVVVLVPPEPPQISVQPNEAIREGQFIGIGCQSTGGNPAPIFQWFFENKTKVPEHWFHEKTEGSRSKSTLQMHVQSGDNGATLICKVWNRAMKEGEFMEVETRRLIVQYAPQVSVHPPQPEMNVEEGDTLLLECSARANPPVGSSQYQWTHVPSGEVHADREWRLPIRRGHGGEFRCSATNSIDSGSARIRLNVLYGPVVKIKAAGAEGAVSPAEGDRLVLDCEAEGNPKVDAFAWSGPGGVRQNGSRLVVDAVNRAHSGNFTCTAWNSLSLSSGPSQAPQTVIRTGHAHALVQIRRRPGAALILAKRLVANVGEQLALGCSTDDGDAGHPPAKFKWAGPGTRGTWSREAEWQRAQLVVAEAKLADNGLYRCVAYNELGQGEEASVRVMIVEPVRISRPLLPNKVLASNAADAELECEARGYPQPNIRWLKDGLQLPVESSRLWSTVERSSSTGCAQDEPCARSLHSTLHFGHPISWLDKGNYSCMADNSPGTSVPNVPAISSQSLTIIHEPQILNAQFGGDGMALAAADLGKMAQLVCHVSARPEPKVSWSRDGLEIGGGLHYEEREGQRRYKVRMGRVAGAIDEFESILELDAVTERDFGTFGCEARNSAGGRKSGLEIRLQPKGGPQSPTEAKLLQSGLSWLLLGWRAGFDGGERQVFELEHRPVDPFTGRAALDEPAAQLTFGPANWTSMAIFESDDSVQAGTFFVHNLTHLRPQSAILYRLRARNARGASDWTPLAMAGTEDARDSLDIQAPESLLYLVDERKLVVQPLRHSAAHCLMVYAASEEDGAWRTIDCFPLANSDGILPGIAPAERFKVRYCMTNDQGKCSQGIKIFVENLPSSNSAWMLAFIVASVCLLSCTILSALFCCRRRFHKANGANGHHLPHHMQHQNGSGPRKTLKLNGAVVMDSRIDKMGLATTKNTPVNGSQTDSGVFTLGSSSAMAATAVAVNGMGGGGHRGGGAGTGNLVGMCATAEENNSGSWNHHHHQQQSSPQHLSPHQLAAMEPYDFSNDPFLQEFAAANALGGIVVVENALHQSSSAESTPSIQQQKSYSKFFNDFSTAFLGGNGTASGGGKNGGGNNRTSTMLMPGRIGGGDGGGGAREPTGNSNEQLLTGSQEGSDAGSGASFGGNAVSGGAAGRQSAGEGGGRVMREIIV